MRGSFQAQSQYNVTRGHQFVAKGMENVVWETIKTTTTTTTTTTIIILLLYHFLSKLEFGFHQSHIHGLFTPVKNAFPNKNN